MPNLLATQALTCFRRIQLFFSIAKYGTILLLVLLSCFACFAQDAGAQAAEQANQQMIESIERANEEATQAGQQARQALLNNSPKTVDPTIFYTQPPEFSVKAGTVSAGSEVRLKSPTHFAAIYYTTDGWLPTTASKRYEGPIKISRTTQIQAIAMAPNLAQSLVATSTFTVKNSAAKPEPSPLVTDGVIRAGTRLHLVTASTVSSKTAQVGDELQLALNQEVKVGEDVLLPKGTPVKAVITQADSAGHAGIPGDLGFSVKSATANGISLTLVGGESIAGANHYAKAKSFLFIPVVGLAGLAVRGDDAVITPGMTLSARVANDVSLQR